MFYIYWALSLCQARVSALNTLSQKLLVSFKDVLNSLSQNSILHETKDRRDTRYNFQLSVFKHHILGLFLFFWDKISWNPGWPGICCVAGDDLELLAFLPPPPSTRITEVYHHSKLQLNSKFCDLKYKFLVFNLKITWLLEVDFN